MSNCKNSSSLMSISGSSSPEALAATLTLGMPVLLKAAFGNINLSLFVCFFSFFREYKKGRESIRRR